jgi:hypothetical protein
MLNATLPALPRQAGVEFRHVAGAPGYCVGADGTLWSCLTTVRSPGRFTGWRTVIGDRWKRLCPWPHPQTGHLYIRLHGARTRKVHRLVLLTFLGPCPPGMECLHGDGDPANNRLDNLRWGTHKENVADTRRHGRKPTKLTEADVREIRRLRAAGMHLKAIGARFGVSHVTVINVVKRRQWAWAC